MKPTTDHRVKFGVAALATGCLLAGLLIWSPVFSVTAQTNQADAKPPAAGADAKTNSVPATNAPAPATAPATNAPAPAGVTNSPGATNESAAKAEPEKIPDEIQLSFQGANIDMIVQWLAQTTGKSVIKHPQVNCQLNIVSSKKVKTREAINLVYRALALEGFNAVESGNSIFIVPEGKEPKLNPVLLDSTKTEIPEGRERMVKIFPLRNISPAELKDKVRIVLSDKGTIDTDDRSGQLIVTDYTDNLRLLSVMIKELDVASQSDSALEVYAVKHADADELGNLISTILNSQPAPKAAARSSSRSSGPQMPPGIIFPGGEMPQPPPSDSGGGGGSASPSASAQIKIWPDKAGNRLIVSAPKSKFPEVERMLDILDVEKTKDLTIRSIPLKNLTASDMVRELGQMYQRMNQRGGKDDVQIAADEQSNSLLIFSSESNYNAIQKLIASLDTEDSQDKIMQTFPLKNADAQDVAKQLQDLGEEKSNNNYSRYFYYGGDFGNNRNTKKKPSVVADRRRNSIVVQAPPAQMPGIAKMISELDAPVTDDSLAPRIYPLKYVSAADIEDVLNELFLKKTQQRSYFNFFDDSENNSPADRDVGRLYGKVRITSEPYSNTLIVTSNSKESLAAVEDVLKQLDQPSQAGETTMRVQLKFGKASDLANNLNILFAKIGSPPLRAVNGQPNQPNNPNPQQPQSTTGASQTGFDLQTETKEDGYYPWLGGQPENTRGNDGKTVSRQVSDLVGRVRVVPDLRANALLISANVHLFPQVLKLVEELDAPTASVLIEARLVEVSTDYLDQLGVRWSPDGSTFTAADKDNSIIASSTGTYSKGFGGNTTVNSPNNSAGTVSQLITSLRSGTINNSISMDFLVQFLHERTHATVLAEPQLNIKDNEMGRLFVGQQVPVPDNNSVSQLGSLNTTLKYKDVGVVLEVTPHINSNGDVALKIHAESSSIVPGATVLGGDVFDSRAFKTDLTAKSGQTLVVGGIIQKQISETMRKTPLLGNIPGLGWAFKKKDSTSQTVELFVFLRPKVIRTLADGDELLKEVDRRAPLVKKWQDENEQRQAEQQEEKKHADKDK